MRALLCRVSFVVSFSLQLSLEIYCVTPFWPAEFLLKNQLKTLWRFPCMLFVTFPLLLLLFFCLFDFCQFDYYLSWHVSPWVYPLWDSLCLLDLMDYFLFHVQKIFNHYVFKNFVIPFLFLFFLSQSVQSVMSNSLWPHGLEHVSLPCPTPTPGAYWNSCPLSLWYQSNHLILCHPLLLLSSIFSSIRVFSNESFLHIRWPKYWSFSFNISPSNEYSGLISFKMECLDLLAIQGTLKSLIQ